MPNAKPRLAGELLLLATLASLWGASYTFIRIGVTTIAPVTLIAAGTLAAGLLLSISASPVGVLIGVLTLGETLSPTAWIGLGAIVLGVAAMSVPPLGRSVP